MMKGNSYIMRIVLSLMCLLMMGNRVCGQSTDSFDPKTQRKALVGQGCMINQIGSEVALLNSYEHLEYITDTDLTNFASITGINVGVGIRPLLSIKDTKNSYQAGTKAGFVLVSTEQSGLLNIDLASMFTIAVYNKGKYQATYTVEQKQGAGLDLGLVQLSGSDNVSIDLTVTPEMEFDELFLHVGGVSVSALSQVCIKYAFVGEAKEYPLIYTDDNNPKIPGLYQTIILDNCGAMPWPVEKKWWRDDTMEDRIFDQNLDNKLSTGGIAIGEWCHVQIAVNEIFEAGTEVGFKYSSAGLLNLSLGGFTTIKLYKDGEEVQSETLKASVLGLGVATVSGEIKTSIIANKPFDAARLTIGAGVLAVDLGEAAGVYYGFIKKKPIVNHHCEINSSLSATLCNGETTYRLASDLPVTWTLESPKIGYEKPNGGTFSQDDLPVLSLANTLSEGVKGNAIDVINIVIPNYDYKFKATAEDGCYEIITLHKGLNGAITTTTCGQPVSNPNGENKYAISNELHESSGSLLSISDMKNAETVVDASTNNYATYVGGLSVANDLGLIGLKTLDGKPFDLMDVDKPRRVGFIVENTSTFLNADVLQFFQIRLYRNGVRLEDSNIPKVIDESNVVGVGLIGTEKSQKVRYSMEVPAGVEFDEFQLWKSGVLDLGLGSLRIYYGFIEDADENCSDPLKSGCAEAVSTTADDNMQVTVTPYMPFSLASVAVILKDISYLVDDDYETAMQVVQTVDAASEIAFSVKLGRTIDDRHQLGVVMDNIAYLAGVNALSALSIETYKNGSSTGEKFENWTTVGLDVIGYGDKNYLVMNPKSPYDEIRFTIGGLASALNGLNFYGLFFRSDIDGDGLPDCIDTTPCPGELTDIAVTEDICKGDYVHLTGMCTLDAGETEDAYDVYLKYPDNSKEEPLGSLTFTEKDLLIDVNYKIDAEPGQGYKLVLKRKASDEAYKEYEVMFTVHPSETTWKLKTNNSTDWNAWANWSDGSPWTCTDVIIPTGAEIYPLLKSGVMNGCRYIHFEPNTEVIKTHYLTYTKAWVEIELKPDRYYMVSAPLKGIYSGDWFIAKNDGVARSNKFQVWNESSYPENRINPTIYQRVWEAASANRLANGGYEGVYPNVTETNWTKPFNLLSTEYNKNEGYDFNALSVWVHPFAPNETTETPTNQDPYVFRFPKEHTKYYYYDENGVIQNPSETLKRENTGRFIYEDADSKFSGFPYYLKVRNIKTGDGHNVYLVGNPFMSHIDVKKFLEENEFITSVKVYDGNANTNVIANPDGDGILVSNSESQGYEYIAPMQSFFVTMTTETPTGIILPDYCEVKFTEEMLVGMAGNNLKSAISDSDKSGNDIRISAEAEGKKAGALLRFTAETNDNFRDREDSEVLIEDEVPPTVAVFTVAEDYALDIQQRRNGGNIPLGLYMAKPADVTLRIDIPEEYTGWVVEDMETKRVYALQPGKENELQLGRMTTNVGRFYLKGESPTGNEVISASQPRISCYMEPESGKLTVHSYDGVMERCEVYSIDGSLRSVAKFDSDEYSFPAYKGVNVVKVCFKDGIQTVRKVSCF